MKKKNKDIHHVFVDYPFVDKAKWKQFLQWQTERVANTNKIGEISEMFTYIGHGYESYGATKITLIQDPMEELVNYSGFANPFYSRVNDRYNQLVLYPTMRVNSNVSGADDDKDDAMYESKANSDSINVKSNSHNNNNNKKNNNSNLSSKYCKVIFTMLTIENLPFRHLDYLSHDDYDNEMYWTVRYFSEESQKEKIGGSIILKESKEKELFGYPILNHIYVFDCFHFENDFIVVCVEM